MNEEYQNIKTLKKLISFINNMTITNTEYDIISNILENYDPKLFVKILEEIANDHMTWLDFKQVLKVDQDEFEKSIENQEELFNQIVLLNQINKTTKEYDFANLFTLYKEYKRDAQGNIIKDNEGIPIVIGTAAQIEKENQILTMITKDSDDIMKNFYNNAVMNKLISENNSDFVDSMLLSVHDYIVPVDYDHIILTDYDKEFAYSHGLTSENMKKIKSLAAFASNYYDINLPKPDNEQQ